MQNTAVKAGSALLIPTPRARHTAWSASTRRASPAPSRALKPPKGTRQPLGQLPPNTAPMPGTVPSVT